MPTDHGLSAYAIFTLASTVFFGLSWALIINFPTMLNRYAFVLGLIVCLIFGKTLEAQSPWGIQTSNYGGIFSTDLQPANLADNRISSELMLGGVSADFWNNYAKISSPLLSSRSAWRMLDTAANTRAFFPDQLNNKEKDLFVNTSLYGPGYMQTFANGIGVSFTLRSRLASSFNNLSEVFAKQAYETQEFAPFYNRPTNNPGVSFNIASYLEFGVGVGAVIFDKGDRFLKAGVKLKYLNGLGAASFHAWQGSYTFHDDSLMSVSDADISYAHSAIFENTTGNIDPRDFVFNGNSGFAVDIGLVYEFRPHADDYKYGVGEYRGHRPDKDAYKARVGISFLDLGGINFQRSVASQNFFGSADSINLDRLDINNVNDLDAFFNNTFSIQTGAPEFRMRLPSRVSIQGDYRFTEKLAAQAVLVMGLGGTSFRRIRAQNTFVVVPRFETKQFGFSLPISYQGFQSLNAGAALRLGPVFLGSNNLINILVSDFNSTANVYAGLRLAFPYGKPKDKDRDGVPNNYDECPEVAGLASLAGCPEPQKENKTDLIPFTITANIPWPNPSPLPEIGTFEPFVSKIIPEVDSVPALAKEDSIPVIKPEIKEETPVVIAEVTPPKKEEKQPEVKKEEPKVVEPKAEIKKEEPKVVKPKPEVKKEEPKVVEPKKEKPPVVAEKPKPKPPLPIEKKALDPVRDYLPYADRDGDGVPNVEDACPDIPGIPKNEGCPELGKGKDFYRANIYTSIYFDSDKSELRPRGKEILTKLRRYLLDNPNARILIEGHTDNSGAEIYNVDLSLNRAMAALRFLVFKDIPFEQIDIAHYGERFPAATNDSSVGMQLNRRIDIVLITN
ncbi:MAG: DUF5723 family protein [Bacteroidia bacterium]